MECKECGKNFTQEEDEEYCKRCLANDGEPDGGIPINEIVG